jgi:hypothetical protein
MLVAATDIADASPHRNPFVGVNKPASLASLLGIFIFYTCNK